MNISQMKQFICILSCGSINKAAEKLNISQSGLSASIKTMEAELGLPLLNRSHHGISLTPFGIDFLNAAQQITEIYDQLLMKAAPVNQERLFISSQFLLYASTAFTSICADHKSQQTKFRFTEKGTDEVINDIINSTSDIGIIVTPTLVRERVLRSLDENGLEGELIYEEPSKCLVGPHSPLYDHPSEYIQRQQLRLFPRVLYEDSGIPGNRDIFQIEHTHFPSSSIITISDTGSFHNFLEQTNCFFIGIHNDNAYSQTKFYNNMRALNISDSDFPYDTFWLRRKGWILTPLAKRYLQMLYHLSGGTPVEDII